jgi:hypothetical protein
MRATVLLIMLFVLSGCAFHSHTAATDPAVPLDLLSDGMSPLGRELARKQAEQERQAGEQQAAHADPRVESSFLGELLDGAPTLKDLVDELGS